MVLVHSCSTCAATHQLIIILTKRCWLTFVTHIICQTILLTFLEKTRSTREDLQGGDLDLRAQCIVLRVLRSGRLQYERQTEKHGVKTYCSPMRLPTTPPRQENEEFLLVKTFTEYPWVSLILTGTECHSLFSKRLVQVLWSSLQRPSGQHVLTS